MSTAEYSAHTIYETYNLGALPQEVKRQLMIIFLNEQQEDLDVRGNYQDSIDMDETEDHYMACEEVPPMLSMEEIRSRMDAVEADIKAGNTHPIDEFFEEAKAKYPWLCE